ncbi:MAG TPA: ankyrin repeat domain-containing protein [Gemmatimonadales bacterium]|jgi:ankyrin repeat protein|nr:ankyrin repeat domain-containing protein [Gemmatimonadales bacterium]
MEIFDVIRAGDKARLETLLAADRTLVDARNEMGHSPVLIAQYHHKHDLVAVLLAVGPRLDIFDACSVGRTERVAELLDADPTLLNTYSRDGFFPLGLAAFFGHAETVRLLLARGADVAQVAKNPMGISAIHAAVAGSSTEAVKMIVEAGAPINAKQHKGWTALHEVVNKKNLDLARFFLAHGADPKVQNDEGKSAIGLAADQGSTDILKLLKGQG